VGLTLIITIVGYLAVISATVNANTLTAVIGLLGTIAGYIVGSELRPKE
jgi:hydrogenase/urease accessory protein HupE